jgi:dipeptidase
VLVGKKASEYRVTAIARNEDYTACNWNKYLTVRPAKTNEPGQTWILGNGLKVSLPKIQYRYSAMPDAVAEEEELIATPGRFFEERGVNEHNVAISATNSVEVNANAQKADPLVIPGIEEAVIPTLILSQATSALHAVGLLGGYVEKYGASEGNGVAISDKNEVWYVEIGSGHHWIAVRVPDDGYLAVANGMRVHSVDLDQTQTVCHSPGLFEFVQSNHLLKNPQRNAFNFAEAFGIPGNPYNVDRVWLIQKMLTSSQKQPVRKYQYPLFLKPDKTITVQNIMTIFRSTYEGTELEGIADRPIGVARTAESHIITINGRMPKELQGVIWQALGNPGDSVYMPFFNTVDHYPPEYSYGNNIYSPYSAYWSFKGLAALGENRCKYAKQIKRLWQRHERCFLFEHPYLIDILKKMYKVDPQQAIDFASGYSLGVAYRTVGAANTERNAIMTMITKGEMGTADP